MSLLLKNISAKLGEINLAVDLELRGRISVIFGPSGSGKTSLLEIIAGLRVAETAFVQLEEMVLTDVSQNVFVPAHQRDIGYVPQDLALFPHIDVRKNVLYGVKPRNELGMTLLFERVVELLEIGLLLERPVTGLSGGEKQRVALARALLASPKLLLLDEPLASLDQNLKSKIIPYLVRLRDEFHIPMIYVTHDRSEALRLADEVIILMEGSVVQRGTTQEVFNRPANPAVANLLKVETICEGRITESADGLITIAVGSTFLRAVQAELPISAKNIYVCIRADDVILISGENVSTSARNRLSSVVQSVAPESGLMRVELDCGFPLTALLTKQACEDMSLKAGDQVTALIKAPDVHLIVR